MKIRFSLFALMFLTLLAGCVERGLVITSDPPGATVTVNQQWTGTTPFVLPFKHYGVFDIWIEHPGYEENGRMVKFYPLHVGEPVKAPGYQYAGADFVTEVLLPTTLYDQHNLHYVLERVDQADDITDVLARAADLRDASRVRREMRAEKDARREPAPEAEPVEAATDASGEYGDVYAPALDDEYYPEPGFDATPPGPGELPVFSNY